MNKIFLFLVGSCFAVNLVGCQHIQNVADSITKFLYFASRLMVASLAKFLCANRNIKRSRRISSADGRRFSGLGIAMIL